jgi:hypothetical protein
MRPNLRACAVLFLITGLLASPAGAATSACPSSIPSSGFPDVSALTAETQAAVDCVVYYRISLGTGTRSFSPQSSVPRWQMALFLERTAVALGLQLPDGNASVFEDLGGLDADSNRAIIRLSQMGITMGTAPGRFSPLEQVPRWQMAVFLIRLLAKAGAVLPNGQGHGFTDIGHLPAADQTAIGQAAQLGIAVGVSSSSFHPSGLVTRAEMALFVSRLLAAGGAHPHRMTLSLSKTSVPVFGVILVTVRVTRPDRTPIAGVPIDIFVATSLKTDGSCVLDTEAAVNGGDAGTSADCRIDFADPRTNSNGEVVASLAHSSLPRAGTVWAWTGADGETFRNTLVLDKVSAAVSWTAAAEGLSLPAPLSDTFGSTINVTAQLIGTGSSVAGQTIRFTVTRAGLPILNSTVSTSSSGAAGLTYTGPADPSSEAGDEVTDVVTAFWDRNGNGIHDGPAEFDAETEITWKEGP